MSRNLQIGGALLFVLILAVGCIVAGLWWSQRTDEASERLTVFEGEVVDTAEIPLVALAAPDPLTDELWTFAKHEEPARIFDEIAWAKAWDFETEMEMAA